MALMDRARRVKRKAPTARAVQLVLPFPIKLWAGAFVLSARDGDWLVFEATGEYSVVPDEVFSADFKYLADDEPDVAETPDSRGDI